MDLRGLHQLYDEQCGVVSRRQLIALAADDNDLRRMVRRRELARVHTGIYVNHTGPLSWVNRAWAAVLFHAPSALCHVSALNGAGDVIHVAVEHPRTGTPLPGVRLHRLVGLDRRVRWNASPPRLRVEEAALDVAADARTLNGAVAVLTEVCRRRLTRPDRLLTALEERPRLAHGRDLRTLLRDVDGGVHSVLEHAYLRRVERPHGLPRGLRQVRDKTEAGVVYRDVVYEPPGLVVELDGRVWHDPSEVRWDDMSRDLLGAVQGRLTIRLGWRHAHDEPCLTALRLGQLLRRLRWKGQPHACGPGCALAGWISVT